MTYQLEAHLKSCVDENPDLSVLHAQWTFDKRLVGTALQSVNQAFPHYSRHDASHSHAILVQIERVLGADRIRRLSASDTWLLLEAAYLHDIGMVVTAEEVRTLWGDKRFRSHIADLCDDGDKDLREACTLLVNGNISDRDTWPLDVARAIRIVVAEFWRRTHADRSGNIVDDPAHIGLQSPRSGLIPDRLFGVLRRVCIAHGKDFDYVLQLPAAESGVAADTAHPRFVACMLRMGDLLDLDNGRFCPVALATFGRLPSSSAAHFAKHASITHLRVDPIRVEVEAVCSEGDVQSTAYEACESWFEMLRKEFVSQQSHWTRIAPVADFGALPSLGRIEVRLGGFMSLGRVEVPADRFAKVLQGANIYSSTAAYIREILQNAVDATLIGSWLEKRAESQPRATEDLIQERIKLLSDHPISVQLMKLGASPRDATKQAWRLTVRDQGVGIARQDVEYIRRVGTSKHNPARRQLIREMPEWLRPSGIFGLGIHSLFMLTQRVQISSRSRITGEYIEIELRGGSDFRPSVLVRNATADASLAWGTSLSVEFDVNPMPRSFSWNADQTRVTMLAYNFDPLCDSELPLETQQIEDSILEYARTSWVPIQLNGDVVEPHETPDWSYDDESGMRLHLECCNSHHGRAIMHYRGVPVEHLSAVPYIQARVDILTGSAEDLLTISRDKLRSDARAAIQRRVTAAIWRGTVRKLEMERASATGNELVKQRLSFALRLGPSEFHCSAGNEWRGLVIAKEVTLGDICNLQQLKLSKTSGAGAAGQSTTAVITSDSGEIESTDESITNYILDLLEREGFRIKLAEWGSRRFEGGAPRVYLCVREQSKVCYAAVSALVDLLSSASKHNTGGCRRTIPMIEGFEDLELSEDLRAWSGARIEEHLSPRLLLPFAFLHDGIHLQSLPSVVSYFETHLKEPLARPALEKRVAELIRYIDGAMKDDVQWQARKAYEPEAIESLLKTIQSNHGETSG